MKKIIVLFGLLAAIYSCTKQDLGNSEYTGEWVLVKMEGSMAGTETTGEDIFWQETYTLRLDGTFVKTRTVDGVTTEVTGVYTVEDYEPHPMEDGTLEKFIVMTHSSENDIVASCSSSVQEYLYFTLEERMISTFRQCDGPGLTYEKK